MGVVEEKASQRSQARALKADVKHSFVFMMRHILRVLAQLTVFQKHKKGEKTTCSCISLGDEYKWPEGQENWQVKSISAAC